MIVKASCAQLRKRCSLAARSRPPGGGFSDRMLRRSRAEVVSDEEKTRQ
jgi:hypothetical protein